MECSDYTHQRSEDISISESPDMSSVGAITEIEVRETVSSPLSSPVADVNAPFVSENDSFGTPEFGATSPVSQDPQTSVNVTETEEDVAMYPATPTEEQEEQSLHSIAVQEEQAMEAVSGEEEEILDTSAGEEEQPLDITAGEEEQPLDITARDEEQLLDISAGEEGQPLDITTRDEEQPLDITAGEKGQTDTREEDQMLDVSEENQMLDTSEENTMVDTTGEEEPSFDITGEEAPTFDTTGEEEQTVDATEEEEPPLDATGEEETTFDPTGEEEPVLDATGEEEPTFDTTGERELTFDTTGEEEPTFDTTGEEEPAFDTTGEEEPAFDTTGEREPTFDTTGEKEPMFDTTGEEEPTFDTTGEEQPEFDTTGEEEPVFDTTGEEEPAFDTTGEEQPTFDAEGQQDQTTNTTEQDQMVVNKKKEKEKEQTPDTATETSNHSVGGGTVSPVLADSTSVDPTNSGDAEMSLASEDQPKDTVPTVPKSKATVYRSRSKRKNVEPKVTKCTATSKDKRKLSVPTVTVTAPSDQSDNSEPGTPLAASSADPSSSERPKRIETFDHLPPGWKRLQILRTGGKQAGRYDTTLYSDTNHKMRSFPNVKVYLERIEQLHLLNDEQYDFQFRQPFTERKKKQMSSPVKKPRSKASTKKLVKSSKTPQSVKSSKTSPKVKSPKTSPKPSLTLSLKRKLPSDQRQDGDSSDNPIWEVLSPPKTKARKRTAPPSKPTLQVKLDRLFKVTSHNQPKESLSHNQPKESKFQSILKSPLSNKQPAKKPEENKEDLADVEEAQVDTHPQNVPSTQTEVSGDETEDVGCCDISSRKSEDVDDMVDELGEEDVEEDVEEHASFVYLADEDEGLFKPEEEEEDNLVTNGKTEDNTMEIEMTEEEGKQREEKYPPEASVSELKNAECDGNITIVQGTSTRSIHKDTKSSDSVTNNLQSVSVNRRMSAAKRSLSPSDSDVSVHKRARLWREADIEEDSSRSVGMCSDSSMPGQEEDENQNMATKVQKMQLSDSPSSKDLKDSASTTSSSSSSQALTVPSQVPSGKTSRTRTKTTKSSTSRSVSPTTTNPKRGQAVETNSSPASQVRPHRDPTWTPPKSPFNLIQERLCHDTWKMLVATIILREIDINSSDPEYKKKVKSAIRLLWKFLNRWPNANEVRKAEIQEIAQMFNRMQHNLTCASTLVRFSEEYQTKDWKYPIELHGIEKCGDDSYRIFCVREWRQVKTDDVHLKMYHKWLSENWRELGLE